MLAVASLLLAGAQVACRASPQQSKVVRPVRVETPDASPCATSSRFTGNVEPAIRVDLAFKRGGYVADLLKSKEKGPARVVEQGDFVRRGTVLARLRDADYRAKLAQGRAQFLQAAAAREQAQQDLVRARELFQGGSISRAMLDGAEARARAADGQERAAEALVDEAHLAVADCALVAPLDGVVLKRLVEVGSLVGPGTPGFVLADTTSMKVVFGVADATLPEVRPGTPLSVAVESLGRAPFDGRVARVAPAADPRTRLFDVEVLLPNADGRLRAGMIASLRSRGEAGAAPLTVPLSAVMRPPGKVEGFAVFVAAGDTLRLRAIETGELCRGRIEVTSGLTSSDRVVVTGAAQSFEGERVTVVP